MDRKEFARQVKEGGVRGAYLFEGPEENIKAAALSQLRKALLPEGLEELNESVMDAPSADALIAAAETLPFLADKRLVVVRDHPALSGRQEGDDRLCDYLAHVPDTCVIVFFHRGKADARKKLYGAIKKSGQIVTFLPLGDAELNSWIIRAFSEGGKQCDSRTASLLSFTVGSDTALLRAEIAKLISLCGERDVVTEDDVRAVATRSVECTVFDMVDAVVAGQEGKAFALMRDMLATGSDRLGILAMLLRQYRLLRQVKIMQYEKKAPQEIKQQLGIPPFAAERCIRQAQRFSGGEVRDAVDACIDTEYRVKSGQINLEGSLEALLLRLFAAHRAKAPTTPDR